MAVQLSGQWLVPNSPTFSGQFSQCRSKPKNLFSTTLCATASFSSPPSTIQIVGGKSPSLYVNENSSNLYDSGVENDWVDLDMDLYHWTKALRPVQWYPGHIAKTEKELKEQLKLMDVVIEMRDARIPMSTSHPQMDSWLGNRKRILVLNREDMICTADRNAWAAYFARQGTKVVFSNGQLGMGTMKLGRLAKALAAGVNVKRRAKGLLPRRIRAGIVGYPNVGKSSLINRLLKRRMCPAAPRPGVTRELKWVRFGKDLELLDSPGMIPMRISDQSAAIKLAICDDIGERSYDFVDVAAILVQMLTKIPSVSRLFKNATRLTWMVTVEKYLFISSRFTCSTATITKRHSGS
ncbi:DAR GTPase 3, chloroplastic isoform X2 [Morus notabilis]|uniref:DAR GTPase 3, chloroplastic isoform X2 n=1 Tax=Morus notabilis TaxID=981085 RepID=UPI000CED02BB|nr:DAR GTPase 3, chloroplastic isoform X2 [Morus notabilis]